MNTFLIILITGFGILIGAILINYIATTLNLSTWYDFLTDIEKVGFLQSIKNQDIISIIFMLLIYPLLLGTIAYYIIRGLI